MTSLGRDLICITDLSLRTTVLETDLWQRPAPREQPLLVSLTVRTDVGSEADSDSLGTESLNYGSITKAIENTVKDLPSALREGQTHLALENIAEQIAQVVITKCNAPNVDLEILAPRVLLSAEAIGVRLFRQKDASASSDALYIGDRFVVKNLRRQIIVGLNPPERVDEQEVVVNLTCWADETKLPRMANGGRAGWAGWRHMVKQVESHLSTSAAGTIETLTTDLAKVIVASPLVATNSTTWSSPKVTVRVSKPCALMFAKFPSVEVTRTRDNFVQLPLSGRALSTSSHAGPEKHHAIIGVGTNMGNRVENISKALRLLESNETVKVKDTSFLYESDAMYHTEQDRFLNGAVRIETTLEPEQLLHALKTVEQQSGREKTFRNGPRVIDLDLLYFDQVKMDTRKGNREDDMWLEVPHPRIAEREFVLRPLVDLAPDFKHPKLGKTSRELLHALGKQAPSTVHQVLPLSGSLTAHIPVSSTLVMSIINTTPDSFSDGGDHFDPNVAVAVASKHLESGAHILDVGGMSTRPGAADVSPEEESSRVVPVIQQIRSNHPDCLISIDTFRAKVALDAVRAGANIINDVCAGQGDSEMLKTMAELDVPVILMHSRGTPKTMSNLTEYKDDDVVAGVRHELAESVRKALDAGVKRWNIVLDPGVGFAKTGRQNLQLLANLASAVGKTPQSSDEDDGRLLSKFPVLVGLSRKKFLGAVTGKQDAKERVFATAAAVTSSIIGGADIIRIHDVEAMVDVAKVTDAIYRRV
ncbi:trifunctional dihydropteroate synthetase [Microbotryomycetes sp. JL201]|nr:trifunctional dihydropteroate synthetase [Microbotryomycetes sp. JL201]